MTSYAVSMNDSQDERHEVQRGPRLRVTPALILWGMLACVAVILLAQNTEEVTVEVFGFDVIAPLFVVIAASLVIGWGLGELGTHVLRWRRRKRHNRQPLGNPR